mmetsp:Transcript_282/g.301  ORF Transcript_282/g.301 Transcript_282/m.301 type:complete len:134 (+) Transcript_282:205-606(+)
MLTLFSITTITFYLVASCKDPGYVMTNIFKVESENSVVHVTEEIPIGINKRKRKKVTRPPSTVLEEIEKENKMLGIDSSGQKARKKQRSFFFQNDFEVQNGQDSSHFQFHPNGRNPLFQQSDPSNIIRLNGEQ